MNKKLDEKIEKILKVAGRIEPGSVLHVAVEHDEGCPALQDHRRTLPEVDIVFHGKLKPFQKAAVKAVLSHDFGTLSAPTGSGKTVIALYAIAQRKQPALTDWRGRHEI